MRRHAPAHIQPAKHITDEPGEATGGVLRSLITCNRSVFGFSCLTRRAGEECGRAGFVLSRRGLPARPENPFDRQSRQARRASGLGWPVDAQRHERDSQGRRGARGRCFFSKCHDDQATSAVQMYRKTSTFLQVGGAGALNYAQERCCAHGPALSCRCVIR